MLLQEIGFLLAVAGMLLTIAGTLVNNLVRRHRLAMKIWAFSNTFFVTWGVGTLAGYWEASLGVAVVTISYLIAFITNAYGLLKFRGRGLP